ncbi:MAG: hypothetical protein ACI9ON_001333 [Limisphaerales bacterium]|jgi:uncharacterized protein YehS (DUF1456 family)
MKTNDCLRRIRYILDLGDKDIIGLFALAEHSVVRSEVVAWLKKDDDPDYVECSDVMFATFLNGLISHKRGPRDGPLPEPEQRMNNNMVFRKLKIAFDLQAEEILQILSRADFNISKHELSAFFRRPGHKHYRDCKDQILRNFLMGLQLKHRGGSLQSAEDSLQSAEDTP